MIDAMLSANRKYAVCGACGRSLCRRDKRGGDGHGRTFDSPGEAFGPDAPFRATLGPVRRYHHVLLWDEDWRLNAEAGYLERTGLDRLARGNAPVRRGIEGESRRRWIAYPEHYPARCPWAACDALNRIDRKRLDVD